MIIVILSIAMIISTLLFLHTLNSFYILHQNTYDNFIYGYESEQFLTYQDMVIHTNHILYSNCFK